MAACREGTGVQKGGDAVWGCGDPVSMCCVVGQLDASGVGGGGGVLRAQEATSSMQGATGVQTGGQGGELRGVGK
jgi:hypothetical protein